MPNLSNIQKDFQNAVMDREPKVPDLFISTKKVSAERRFDVYSEAYRLRLVECLETNYPVLAQYLGEEAFFELGLGYIYEYPSQNPSVRWFGHRLAEFISETEEYGENEFLIELAQLEWIFTLTFDAADAEIISFSDLISIPPDDWANLSFEFHPAVHHLNVHWNCIDIWEAIMNNEKKIPKPKKLKSEETWVFWRKELDISFDQMDAMESEIFDLARAQNNWQTLCESLLDKIDESEIPHYIAKMLQKWLAQGLISHFLIKP